MSTLNPPRRRRWPKVLGVIAVLLVPAYWWFFLQVPEPSGDWSVDMAEVRRLAGSLEGDKPTEIRVERTWSFKFPFAVIRTGGGWGLKTLQVFAFQLVFPTRTAILDTALITGLPGGTMDSAALDRLVTAMNKANLIFVTHEHGDHLGGLAAQNNVMDLLKVTKLNREQITHPEILKPAAFPPGALDGYQPLTYDKYLALAPGVVLIRAAGHTPGSQLVYVQRADGAELLFLGDVAWTPLMVDEVAERPRAVAMVAGEDRGLVIAQLAVLHTLRYTEPKLHFVYGHDPEVVDALVSQHLLEEKFK